MHGYYICTYDQVSGCKNHHVIFRSSKIVIECHDIRPNTIVPGKLVCSISTSTVNCKQVANVRRSIANVAQK